VRYFRLHNPRILFPSAWLSHITPICMALACYSRLHNPRILLPSVWLSHATPICTVLACQLHSPISYAGAYFRYHCEIRVAGLVWAPLSQHVSGEIVIGKIMISLKPPISLSPLDRRLRTENRRMFSYDLIHQVVICYLCCSCVVPGLCSQE